VANQTPSFTKSNDNLSKRPSENIYSEQSYLTLSNNASNVFALVIDTAGEMVKWMCCEKVKDKLACTNMKEMLELEDIITALQCTIIQLR